MITQENIPYTADEIKAMVKTIEELRRKYNKALERARALNNGKDADVEAGTTICEYIFPELKVTESKDDRIRKEIISAIHNYAYWANEKIPTEWLDWLEKQKTDNEDKDKEAIGVPIGIPDTSMPEEEFEKIADKLEPKNPEHAITVSDSGPDKTWNFTITLEQRQDLYDREFNSFMQKSKDALVRMLIGERPVI